VNPTATSARPIPTSSPSIYLWNTYDTERYGFSLDASYKLGESHLLELRGDFFDEELSMDGSRPHPTSMHYGGGYGKPKSTP